MKSSKNNWSEIYQGCHQIWFKEASITVNRIINNGGSTFDDEDGCPDFDALYCIVKVIQISFKTFNL